MPDGAGPRHFVFHPQLPFAYVANELTGTVNTLAYDANSGRLEIVGEVPSTDSGAPGNCSAIRLAPDGKFLFVGNRGDNTIARFDIDPQTGLTHPGSTTPVGGKIPRDFVFSRSGEIVAVANQDSDTLTFFRYASETGALTPLGEPVPAGSPTSVAFAT